MYQWFAKLTNAKSKKDNQLLQKWKADIIMPHWYWQYMEIILSNNKCNSNDHEENNGCISQNPEDKRKDNTIEIPHE